MGYKAHATETCDDDTPHVITHVETTPATTPDDNMLEPIHAALAAQALLPRDHLVDCGYTDAETLVDECTGLWGAHRGARGGRPELAGPGGHGVR